MKPSDALHLHRAELRQLAERFGVSKIRVFGSAANGADHNGSDLDLLIDPPPGITLLTIAALQNDAERLLGVRVDVQTPKSISRRFRDEVLKRALPV